MKKYLPIIIVLVLLFIVGGIFIFLRGKKPTEPPKIPEKLAPEWTLEERPYITLTPREDGREFKMRIEGVKDTKLVDYELIYFSNEISRGVTGSIDLGGGTMIEKDLLLGSCSKNVCKYDENVTEGSLSLRFQNSEGKVRKYELAFHLQKGEDGQVGLTSGDGNFSFQGKLPADQYYLTLYTVGLPGQVQGKLVAGPYGIFTGASQKTTGKINLKPSEATEKVKVFGWDSINKTWKEYQEGLKMSEKVISVEVNLLTTFIAVAP